jgi:hypothetical protein
MNHNHFFLIKKIKIWGCFGLKIGKEPKSTILNNFLKKLFPRKIKGEKHRSKEKLR